MQSKSFKNVKMGQEKTDYIILGSTVEHKEDSAEVRGIYVNGKRAPSIEEEPGAYGANN
jgi:hypothetical protein